MYLLLLVLPGTARYCQVLLLQVLDCRYWYCWYVILLVVGVVGVHGCIISHMYTPHFKMIVTVQDKVTKQGESNETGGNL